jgi:hypothetical protein
MPPISATPPTNAESGMTLVCRPWLERADVEPLFQGRVGDPLIANRHEAEQDERDAKNL